MKFIKAQNLRAEGELEDHLTQAHPTFTERYTEAEIGNDRLDVISMSRGSNDRTRILNGPSWLPLCPGNECVRGSVVSDSL